jgi:hypothetical protein
MPKVPQLVKFTNGDVVMGVVEQRGNQVQVARPLMLLSMPRPNEGGGVGMAISFVDFVPGCSEDVVKISGDHVLCVVNAQDDLVDLYDRLTNPNHIDTPNKGLVLPG